MGFELLSLLGFRMIFVIEAFVDVKGHTFGFLGVQLCLSIIAAKNMYFDYEIDSYPFDFIFGKRVCFYLSMLYVFGLFCATGAKFFNTIGLFYFGGGLFDVSTEGGLFMAHMADTL